MTRRPQPHYLHFVLPEQISTFHSPFKFSLSIISCGIFSCLRLQCMNNIGSEPLHFAQQR